MAQSRGFAWFVRLPAGRGGARFQGMSDVISRRGFLAATSAAALLPGMAMAGAPAVSLRPVARSREGGKLLVESADALVAEAGLGKAVTGYAVADLKTGQMLETGAGGTGLPPASVAKAITALYALDTLGGDYRFATRLLATGPVVNGEIKGDLVLAGGGDPTLDTDGLAAMARDLKAAGVTGVKGRFLIWGGALPYMREIDGEQPDHVGYNPAISGLALNFNRVHFEWKRKGQGWGVTMDARSEKYRPEVRVARMAVVKRRAPVYTYRDKGGLDDWTVARGALGNGGSRWLPVRRPDLYCGEVLRYFARAQGIALKEGEVVTILPAGSVMVQRPSAPLREVLGDMLKYSTNLTAEMVGLAATHRRKGAAVSIKASAAEMSAWARGALGMQGARLVDHSGLGAASNVSAMDMVRALVAAGRAPLLRPIMKDIHMRDDNGRVDKAHPIKVQAKTGTLNFVSGLAGYMTAADGTDLAFAVFSADEARRARLSEAQRERPEGGRSYTRRAKQLQQRLIERWGAIYGS